MYASSVLPAPVKSCKMPPTESCGMPQQIDLRVVELICSRLCHDLISPISAINNGIELVTEVGEEARADADILIAESAVSASRRLRAFRYAYGLAGQDVGIDEIRNVALAYFEGTKTQVDWPPISVALPQGAGKVILNFLLLTPEIVRGTSQVSLSASPGEIALQYKGSNAKLDEDLGAALNGAVLSDNLDPRTAHAVLTAAQAARIGCTIVHTSSGTDAVNIRLHWKA